MPSHTLTKTWTRGSESLSTPVTKTADQEKGGDYVIPNATTDQLVTLTVDVSEVESLYMVSDQDVSFQTNNAGTPVQTIAMKANVPITYTKDSGETNPLTTDITAIYLTNASGATATVKIRILENGTP